MPLDKDNVGKPESEANRNHQRLELCELAALLYRPGRVEEEPQVVNTFMLVYFLDYFIIENLARTPAMLYVQSFQSITFI